MFQKSVLATMPQKKHSGLHGEPLKEPLPPKFLDFFFHYKEPFVYWKGSIDEGSSLKHQCQ